MQIENRYRFLIKQLVWFILLLYILMIVGVHVAGATVLEIVLIFLATSALCGRMAYKTLMRCGRRYIVDKDGLTVIWINHKITVYQWSDFAAVEERTLRPTNWSEFWPHCMICSKIPIQKQYDGYVDAAWPMKHLREVFDIPMSEEQCEEFWTFVPESIPSNRYSRGK